MNEGGFGFVEAEDVPDQHPFERACGILEGVLDERPTDSPQASAARAKAASDAWSHFSRSLASDCAKEEHIARAVSAAWRLRRARVLATCGRVARSRHDAAAVPDWCAAWYVVECAARVYALECAGVAVDRLGAGVRWVEYAGDDDDVLARDEVAALRAACSGAGERPSSSERGYTEHAVAIVHEACDVLARGGGASVWWERGVGHACASALMLREAEGFGDSDWVEANRPTEAAIRQLERSDCALAAARLLEARLVQKRSSVGGQPGADESARVVEWARKWGDENGALAEAHHSAVTEALLRAGGPAGCVPCSVADVACPRATDAPERGGAESRARPHAFALGASRPSSADEATRMSRALAVSVWRDAPSGEDRALGEAAMATLAYCVQQECDVDVRGRYLFDDGEPWQALSGLELAESERGATRRVPRMVRSAGKWWLVRMAPAGGASACGPWEWYEVASAWAQAVRDDAEGALARRAFAPLVVGALAPLEGQEGTRHATARAALLAAAPIRGDY